MQSCFAFWHRVGHDTLSDIAQSSCALSSDTGDLNWQDNLQEKVAYWSHQYRHWIGHNILSDNLHEEVALEYRYW